MIDRCPECGLRQAKRYRDPTYWVSAKASLLAWLLTAISVWLWDRRVRLRTSFIPSTQKSKDFSRLSVMLTSTLCGLAIGVVNLSKLPDGLAAISFFVVIALSGFILSFLFLSISTIGTRWALTGMWRHIRCVSASVHYSTAWWVPTGIMLALLACANAAAPDQKLAIAVMAPIMVGVMIITWAVWLWSSISEAERLSYPSARLGALMCGLAVFASALTYCVPHLTPKAVKTVSNAVIAQVKSIGTPQRTGPRTRSIVIDAIPSRDELLIRRTLTKMGAESVDRITLHNAECTIEAIDLAFLEMRQVLTPKDKFILYINGHGAKPGAGAIRIADGYLTSQTLADFFDGLPTKNSLVIIDSCYGGKFIPAMRKASNAVVIASTDNRNLAFSSILMPFWKAFDDPQNDWDQDGLVAVGEAFWSAFGDMLEQGDEIRDIWITREGRCLSRKEEKTVLKVKNDGLITPQLVVLGEADDNVFAVKLPDSNNTADENQLETSPGSLARPNIASLTR